MLILATGEGQCSFAQDLIAAQIVVVMTSTPGTIDVGAPALRCADLLTEERYAGNDFSMGKAIWRDEVVGKGNSDEGSAGGENKKSERRAGVRLSF